MQSLSLQKKMLKSLIIAEFQIKMRPYYLPIHLAGTQQNRQLSNCSQGCTVVGTLIHCWWEYKMTVTLEDSFW